MYKQVKTDKQINWYSDDPTGKERTKFLPIATLANKYGGRCQIIICDHCYTILTKPKYGLYQPTKWIFKEAFEVLKTLPSPT